MTPNKNIGVITEQGFVAGNGLGFSPVNEKDLDINEEQGNNPEQENNPNNSK